MVDLKTDFRKWLIAQGFKEKTPNGRPSTVYEYIRRVDRLCDSIYGTNAEIEWKRLANNVDLILSFYILCQKGPLRITKETLKDIYSFLSDFLNSMPSRNQLDHYRFSIVYKKLDVEYDDCPIIRDFLIDYMEQDDEIILSLNGTIRENNKDRIAFIKFYEFLLEIEFEDENTQIEKIFKDEQGRNLRYVEIERKLSYIKIFADKNTDENFYIMIEGGTNNTPPKLVSSDLWDKTVKTEASSKGVCGLLRIDIKTLKRLADNKILTPLSNGKYSIETVNEYISKKFYKAQYSNAPSGKAVKEWWTAKEVHEKTGLDMKKIQRLRQSKEISYIKSSQKVYIYYPPDLTRFSKKKI